MHRIFIALLFLIISTGLFAQAPDFVKPNIIVIMADDLSLADISLSEHALVQTPNIDRLAGEGVNFTNGYVGSPVCSPSRSSFITGRYAQRFGFQFQIHERYPRSRLEYFAFKWFVKSYPWIPKKMKNVPSKEEISRQGLPPGEVTLPEIMKEAGYLTALIGKWHLGYHESNIPCKYDLDFQYGFWGSHSLYIQEKTEGYIDQKVKQDFTDKFIWKGQREGIHALYRNCERIEESGYLTDRITEEAIGFMERSENKPFFLWVSYSAPHSPFQCKQTHYDQLAHIKNPVKRVYNAILLSLDQNIGQLLEAVEKQGDTENTMIVFLSDNGGAEYTTATDNGDYKGGKITDLEGGIKVPMFIKWKNVIPAGTTYDLPVIAMDLLTTMVIAAGGTIPDDRPMDGVDLIPFVLNQKEEAPHEYLYWQRGDSRALRSLEYKLLINDHLQDTVLFEINTDPFENHNLFSQQKQKARELVKVLNDWSTTLPPPLWPAAIYYEFMDGEQRYLFDQ